MVKGQVQPNQQSKNYTEREGGERMRDWTGQK